MELTVLLQEQESIKEKISAALTTLKQWFLDKIDQVKEIFASIKDKVSEKVRTIRSNAAASKDVKDADGNILVTKGTTLNKIKIKIASLLLKVKKDGDVTIRDCKSGVDAVSKGDAEKAKKTKSEVLATAKTITATIGGILLIISTLVVIDQKGQDNKNAFNNAKADARYERYNAQERANAAKAQSDAKNPSNTKQING